jgi:O-antigen/teichoic acid export membrane protein
MKQVGSSSLIISLGMFWQQVLVFLIGVVVARVLGPEAFGIQTILKNLSVFFLLIAPLGLDLALLKHVRLMGGRSARFELAYAMSRTLVLLVNLVALTIVAVWLGPTLEASAYQVPGFAHLLNVTVIGVIFAADLQLAGAVHRGVDLHLRYAVVTYYAQPFIRLLLTAGAAGLGYGLEGVVWAGVVASGLCVLMLEGLAGLPLLHLRDTKRLLLETSHKTLSILREAVWMGLSLLSYGAVRFLDVLVVGYVVSAKAAGEYGALSGIAQVIQIYPMAISQTLGAQIATLFAGSDFQSIRAVLRRYVRLAALVGGYLAAGVAVFGTELDLVFGPDFHFSAGLSILLAAGWFVSAVLSPFGFALSMTGRHRLETVILSTSVVAMASLLVWLTDLFGSEGAALAVALGFGLANGVRCFVAARVLGGLPLRLNDMLPPAVFLALGYATLATGSILGRSFPLLLIECSVFSVLCGIAAFAFFMDADQRNAVLRSIARLRGSR